MNKQQEKQMRNRLAAYAGFTIHFSIYVGLMIFIWIIWLAGGGTISDFAWPVFPTIAWGFILVVHYFSAQRGLRGKSRHTT